MSAPVLHKAVALVGADPTSAPVTEWPIRLLLTLGVLAVIALACWAMWRGWVNRGRRQESIVEPDAAPEAFTPSILAGCPGRYLASTTAGQWLDRVVAHGLGAPGRATVKVGDAGVLLEREGAPDLFVPAADVRAVRADRGIAGAVFEQGGVLVITWALGEQDIDTGFRAVRTDEHVAVAAAVQSLLDAQPSSRGTTAGTTAPTHAVEGDQQ